MYLHFHVIQTETRDPFTAVLYQFLETGSSDITFMGRNQLDFSLYPLSFFLYSPFKDDLTLFEYNERSSNIFVLVFFGKIQ